MTQDINAEIISIGTEILLGEITDTNSVHIARVLRDIGVSVYFMTSVGDNEKRITGAIRLAMSRAQVVITTGGLGPTVDDMTRQAVANATGRDLVFHQDLLDKIAERFAGFRSAMTDNNRRQAFLPAEAILIENPVGTAPSYVVEHDGHLVISVPGVPREMKFLLAEKIVPFLRERYQLGIIKAVNLRAAGIGESALDDMIGVELLEKNNPTVGLAAHSGVIDVRVTAKAESESAADQMIADVVAALRERIGEYVFGQDGDTIQAALVRRLQAGSGTLAISEVGIGDPVSSRIKAVPGGDAVLVFTEQADSPDGEPDLREMAQSRAQQISNPDYNSDRADSDVGTAVAVFTGGKVSSRVYGFGSKAEESRLWTSTWTLARAWRMLDENAD